MNIAQITGQFEPFVTQLLAWAAVAVPSAVGALVILVVGWWFAGWAARAVRRLLAGQARIDPTLRGVTASLVRYAVLIFVVVAVLAQLGVQTTSVLAVLGAAGLAIGLAIQGTLSNIAAGIMLLLLRPFNVGEYIECGPTAGTVREVGLFACQLESWDGIFQFVPNQQLWNARIVNHTRLPNRLVELKYGVGYGDDIDKGLNTLLELGRSDARVHAEPAPIAFVDSLADSAVVLNLRVWTATAAYWNVRRDLTAQGKRALEAAGLSIPFPQRDVHIRNGAPAPIARVA